MSDDKKEPVKLQKSLTMKINSNKKNTSIKGEYNQGKMIEVACDLENNGHVVSNVMNSIRTLIPLNLSAHDLVDHLTLSIEENLESIILITKKGSYD